MTSNSADGERDRSTHPDTWFGLDWTVKPLVQAGVVLLASGVVLLVIGYTLIRTAEASYPGTRDESRSSTD
ncbi:hypothetical protein [Halovivax gelatinilyticus]|uniref:hypothetical protein n=1 Tax=Halovivax gelatinilyticus TaxID=2961597 RepID=UPI0020CA9A5A|nr:hypothetical protein [Halovivax gelatinilyticus]